MKPEDKDAAIRAVAAFLEMNYPHDHEGDCDELDEATSIVEIVETVLLGPDLKCKHCGEPIYEYNLRWRHRNGMYTCARPGKLGRRPLAAPA